MVNQYAVTNLFNGTVLVQNNHKIIYHKSFGVAKGSFSWKVTNETEYQVYE